MDLSMDTDTKTDNDTDTNTDTRHGHGHVHVYEARTPARATPQPCWAFECEKILEVATLRPHLPPNLIHPPIGNIFTTSRWLQTLMMSLSSPPY